MTFKFDGVEAFLAGLQGVSEAKDRATRKAVAEGLLAIQRQAQLNSSGRPGPNVQTGSHRRSFRVEGPKSTGVGQWEGSVGPTMVYSRRLELGGGNWPAGLRFPYMEPAVKFAREIAIPVIFHRVWAAA